MNDSEAIDVGVIGVGSMGQNHARVYNELPNANLIGVYDVDRDAANAVSAEYGTMPLAKDELLARVDAVSLAVPTQYHYEAAVECIDAGVGILIEKPVVEDPDRGRELAQRARSAGVTVQVGHIERFNPAIQAVQDIVEHVDIIGIHAERLGPQPDRAIADSAILDLMIHDVDIVSSLLSEEPRSVASAGVHGNCHASALLEYDSGAIATLTASRRTQRKIRTLEITAEDCFIEVDYIDQSIDIHRHSVPEYIREDGNVRYRHESVIEQPAITNGEPLKFELSSFVDAVRDGTEPEVPIEDGIRALELATEIERAAGGSNLVAAKVSHD